MALAVLLTLFCSVSARAEAFLDVAFGGAFTHPTDIRIEGPSRSLRFTNVPVRTRSFESPPHYLIRAGYMFFEGRPSVGLSFALLHLKYFPEREATVNEGRMADTFDRFSISHGYNHFPLEVLFRTQLGRFQPYVSGGPSLLIIHPEITYRGEALQAQYVYGGVGLNATVGTRFYVWEWLGLVGEYRISASDASFELGGERFEVTERSHHFHLGVTVSSAVF